MGVSAEGKEKNVEVSIDLHQISSQKDIVEKLDTDSSLCSLSLETDETTLKSAVFNAGDMEIEQALDNYAMNMESSAEVTLFQHESGNYLLFRLPGDEYKDLEQHAYKDFDENVKHIKSVYLIALPITIIADAVIIYASAILIVACVFFPPACIPAKVVFGVGDAMRKTPVKVNETGNSLFEDY
jgi:hypothetical protein